MAIGAIAVNAAIAIGTNLLIGLLTPSQKTSKSAKRAEANTPKSEFGPGIWQIYGSVRRDALPLIWADTLDEIVKEEEQDRGGKGGGGGSVTTEKIFYLMDAAWLIGEPIEKIKRIWLNGKLMWSEQDTSEDGQDFFDNHVEIYDGTQISPDPTIVDHEGSDIPAFTGRSYIVIRDLDTQEFDGGTSMPKIDVEIQGKISNPNGGVSIEDIFNDILLRSGLEQSEFDLSDISGSYEINGFPLKNEGEEYREILEELMEFFQIISYDIDGVKYFTFQKRDNQIPIKIPAADMGTKEIDEGQKDLFKETKINENENPSRIEIEYSNINNNHDSGHQQIYNVINRNDNPKNIQTDAVLNDTLALFIITNILNQIESQKFKYEEIFLPPQYFNLKPGDRILLPIRNYHEQAQIKRINLNANFSVEIEAVLYGFQSIKNAQPSNNVDYSRYNVVPGDEQVFDSESQNENEINITESSSDIEKVEENDVDPGLTYSSDKQIPTQYTKAIPHPVDIPLVSETDEENGIYVAIEAQQPWRKGELYISIDDESNYTPFATCISTSVVGTVSAGSLDSGYEKGDDDNTSSITVSLSSNLNKGLKNVTDNEFLAGKQLALIGSEIVSFKNANEVSPGVYDVSRFIRSFKGWEVPSHSSNERFILLTGYLKRIEGRSDFIGRTAYFKIPHSGQNLDRVSSRSLTIQGESLKPAPPTNISATEDIQNNLKISWQAQERGLGKTAGENYQNYKIEILDGPDGNVIRSEETNKNYFIYEKSQIDSDGIDINDLNLKIYKKSSAVGWGHPAEAYPVSLNSQSNESVLDKVFNVISYPKSQGNAPKTIDLFPEKTSPTGTDKLLVQSTSDYSYVNLENIDFGAFSGTTDDIEEGSVNLYFTNARVDTRLSNLGLNAIGNFNDTGGNSPSDGYVISWDDNNNIYKPQSIGSLNFVLDDIENVNASNKSEGYSLQWDSTYSEFRLKAPSLNASSTDLLSEGSSNLYYTESRVNNYVTSHIKPQDLYRVDESNLNDRSILIYDTSGTINFWRMEILSDTTINNTDDLDEGVYNLYYTAARVDSRIGNAWLSDLRNDFYINNLNNVDDSGKTTGDALIWDGSNYVPGNPNIGIDMEDLGNTNINSSTLTSGQLLVWDGNSWDNQDATDITNLGDIDNVNVSSGYNRFLFRSNSSGDWNSTNLFDTRGDILVGNGGTSFTDLSVGADGQIIVADSNQSEGLRWSDPEPAYLSVQTLSTNYTIQSLDHASIFRINDSLTISLPTNLTPGFYFYARLEDSGLTLDLSSGGTIDGINQLTINKEQIKVVYQGNNIWLSTKITSADIGNLTTDDVSEGTNNLYFTDSRVDGRLENITVDTFGDIEFSSLQNGDFFYYENGKWVNKIFSNLFSTEFTTNFNNSNIGSLLDVEGTTPTDDDILIYDNSQFKLISLSGSVSTELQKLDIEEFSNVSSTTPNDGDVLTYNGSTGEWEPQASSSSGDTASETELTNIWLFGGF